EDGGQAGQVVVAQFLGSPLRVDVGLFAEPQRQRRPDAVDVAQRDVRRLVVGDVHTQDTRHYCLLDQPWRCLWRGVVQMTSILPWRRTSLQFSQMRFTLARTFIVRLPSRLHELPV